MNTGTPCSRSFLSPKNKNRNVSVLVSFVLKMSPFILRMKVLFTLLTKKLEPLNVEFLAVFNVRIDFSFPFFVYLFFYTENHNRSKKKKAFHFRPDTAVSTV